MFSSQPSSSNLTYSIHKYTCPPRSRGTSINKVSTQTQRGSRYHQPSINRSIKSYWKSQWNEAWFDRILSLQNNGGERNGRKYFSREAKKGERKFVRPVFLFGFERRNSFVVKGKKKERKKEEEEWKSRRDARKGGWVNGLLGKWEETLSVAWSEKVTPPPLLTCNEPHGILTESFLALALETSTPL